ncbi:MAG: OmpA family protein [Duncaniella sp.]|nr:OmpA family protein [Duncaniella sp.]
MNKLFLAAALAGGMFATASAQNVIERPTFADNWSIGFDAGVTSPFLKHNYFKNIRPQLGLHIEKQLTPLVGVGVEGAWGINTTSSKTAFDSQYVGGYGTLDLTNVFGGFRCTPRPVDVDLVAGLGWLHYYTVGPHDTNDLGARTGFRVNFNVTDKFSIAVKPAIVWDLTASSHKVAFNRRKANTELMIGFNYNFGPGFQCVTVPEDLSATVDALNAQVNALRADVEGTSVALAAATAQNAQLAQALADCQNAPAKVIEKNTNTLESVRYVFFRIGSSVITADQMPNVEMIAAYLNNHPDSKVEIKGYASQDGNLEFNERLAAARAESVKNALIKKYKIKADRITAKGEGIGHMFSEESWNRVSICTLD